MKSNSHRYFYLTQSWHLRPRPHFSWQNSHTKKFPKTIVYIIDEQNLNMIEMLSSLNDAVDNQNFIKAVNESTVDLVTSYRFSPGRCMSAIYKTINQFSSNTVKWENDTFFPEKYDNFYGCPLRVGYTNSSSTTTSREIFNILAQDLNFTIVRVELDENDPTTMTDIQELLFAVTVRVYQHFDVSSALFFDELTVTVPFGEPYSQFEKMFSMFDDDTWICIAITLIYV